MDSPKPTHHEIFDCKKMIYVYCPYGTTPYDKMMYVLERIGGLVGKERDDHMNDMMWVQPNVLLLYKMGSPLLITDGGELRACVIFIEEDQNGQIFKGYVAEKEVSGELHG